MCKKINQIACARFSSFVIPGIVFPINISKQSKTIGKVGTYRYITFSPWKCISG